MGRALSYETPTILQTTDGEDYRETIKRGAARKYIQAGKKTRALVGHDKAKLLARSDKHTLQLRENEIGVDADILIPRTTLGADTLSDVENQNLDGFSAAWSRKTVKDRWYRNGDGMLCRDIYELDLSEVSLTGDAAYPGTFAEVREIQDEAPTVDQDEMTIRLIEKMIECE